MSHFYNYDTRGASSSSQIIWLENRVRELEEQLEQAVLTEREACAKICEDAEIEYWGEYIIESDPHTEGMSDASGILAEKIRARSNV